MNRTLAIHASDESFKLYKGTSTFGNLLFTQPEISQSGTYVWTVCLEDGGDGGVSVEDGEQVG